MPHEEERTGGRIRALRKARGLTQGELAARIDMKKSIVSDWESGKREPKMEALRRIAAALDADVGALIGLAVPGPSPDEREPEAPREPSGARPLPANLKPLSGLHVQRVPLIGRVAAGAPIMAEEDYETVVTAPVKCDCALEVRGDSMSPIYESGDIVYIRRVSDVADGRIAVVLLDDEAALKYVYHDRDGLTLISENRAYGPIVAHRDEYAFIAVYGVPVGFTRMFTRENDPLSMVKKGFGKA